MVLATRMPDGTPRATPVFFAADPSLRLVFLSDPKSVHSPQPGAPSRGLGRLCTRRRPIGGGCAACRCRGVPKHWRVHRPTTPARSTPGASRSSPSWRRRWPPARSMPSAHVGSPDRQPARFRLPAGVVAGMSGRDLDRAALRGEPSYVWRAGQERRLRMILDDAGDRALRPCARRRLRRGAVPGAPRRDGAHGLGRRVRRERARAGRSPRASACRRPPASACPSPHDSFDLILSPRGARARRR